MALYTKSQLAKLLGKQISWVSTYASEKRKKIIMRGDFIDDQIPQNAEFIEKWLAKKVEKDKEAENESPHVPQPKTPNYTPPEVPENWEEIPDDLDSASNKTLDRVGKIIEIKRKQAVITLSELKAAKLRGESIPTSLVMDVFTMLGQQLQTSYKDGATNFIMEIAHKAKLDPEIVAELRSGLIKMINTSHHNAITQTKQQIKAAISDNAQSIADEPDE